MQIFSTLYTIYSFLPLSRISYYFPRTTTVSNVAVRELSNRHTSESSPVHHSKRQRAVNVTDQMLFEAQKHAKQLEWDAVLRGLDKGFIDVFAKSGTPDPCIFVESLRNALPSNPQALFEGRLRQIVKVQQLLGKNLPETSSENLCAFIQSLKDTKSIHAQKQKVKEWLTSCNIGDEAEVLDKIAQDLFEDFCCFTTPNAYARDFEKLKQDIHELLHLFKNIPFEKRDPKQHCIAILYTLRDALKRPAYRLMRTEEAHPLVNFLHAIAVASFCNPEVVPAYMHIGDKLCDAAKVTPFDALPDAVQKTRDTAVTAGFLVDDEPPGSPLCESLEFTTNQIMARVPLPSALHNGWSYYSARRHPEVKDYRGFYDNNPGLLYAEQLHSLTNRVLIVPSPAAGSSITPEFSAMLQSIENCRVLKRDLPYHRVAYSNLQDKKGGIEELQTKALMQLNYIYPLSFSGITVWQGSYKSGNKDKPFDENQKVLKLNELHAEDNFMLVHEGKGMGYWFKPDEKELWKKAMVKIVDLAYERVYSKQEKDEVKFLAFSGLVETGIIRHNESQIAKAAEKLGVRTEQASMRPCKPAADRSVAINMKFMSTQKLDSQMAQKVTSFGIGRAICAKGRLPLAQRVITELGALFKVVTPEEFRHYLAAVDALDDPNGYVPKKKLARTLDFS